MCSNSLKKSLSLCIIALAMMIASTTVSAQGFRVGGGIVIGTEFDGVFGIQASGVYPLLEEQGIDLAADISIYFPDSPPGVDFSLFAINANGHYNFTESETLMAYAIAGLNFAFGEIGLDLGEFGSTSGDFSDVGLNLGAGVEFAMPFGYIYAQGKVVAGGIGQFVASGGVRFPIGD